MVHRIEEDVENSFFSNLPSGVWNIAFNLKVRKYGDGRLGEINPNVVKEGTETQ